MNDRYFPDAKKCTCGKIVMVDEIGMPWEPDWPRGKDAWQIHSCTASRILQSRHLTPQKKKHMIHSISRQTVK